MPRKITTEDFIERSKQVHGDKYDYSKSIYIGIHENIEIICKKHGSFWQEVGNHYSGKGCFACAVERNSLKLRSSKEEFIERANKIHGNKYNYSKVDYKNCDTNIIIICKKHGEFLQTPYLHLNTDGCKKCSDETKGFNCRLKINEFIEKANKIHSNKYDYSKVIYNDTKTSIVIICPDHGQFLQTPDSHLRGRGCLFCSGKYPSLNNFLNSANKKHNYKYDYSLVVYKNAYTPIKIVCSKHGIFEQTPTSHLSGCGCSKCQASRGELAIESFLRKNTIFYKSEFRLKDCRNKKPLPFDFAIFEDEEKTKLKCLIEYDGEQHFEICEYFHMSRKDLEKVQKRDQIKTEFCLKNNIKLIRIPYWEFDNIENILEKLEAK